MDIESKLPDVGVTIFTVMSALANQHGAINLSQGFPDFNAHPDLLALVGRYMQEGHNQYAPMQGAAVLRERIAKKVQDLYGARYDPVTEITVTSGATEALFAAVTALVRPGDEALVIEPAYDAYVPAIRLNAGVPVYARYRYPGYRIDWDEVRDRITAKTRIMLINSPHNPTGAVFGPQDIGALTDIVRSSGVFIISDEVYEHIIFDGRRHESMARYPELAERSFVISSFGKTYHTTGWKIGYCLAPEYLSREFQRIHQFVTFSSNTPIQLAYADFLERRETYLDLAAFYQKKRDLFLSLIETSRFKPIDSWGTYFQMLDYRAISDEPDVAFARRMTAEYGVAAIPPSAFYHKGDDHGVLRFCFAKRDDTLREAARKLCRI